MTFREYMEKNYPERVNSDAQGGVMGCPYHYGLERLTGACPYPDCYDCWNREMPKIDKKPMSEITSDAAKVVEEVNESFDKPRTAIKDSGDRTEFASGAVRDMHEGKGRCDLMPLDVVNKYTDKSVFKYINEFQKTGDCYELYNAITSACLFDSDPFTMFLEVAKHFEEGCKKYGENNWRKGIPVKCYIDSAVRHYLKYLRGDKDEPHDRAFCWNILCCIWTVNNIPGALEESGYGTSV